MQFEPGQPAIFQQREQMADQLFTISHDNLNRLQARAARLGPIMLSGDPHTSAVLSAMAWSNPRVSNLS